jgi:hypothetical protein
MQRPSEAEIAVVERVSCEVGEVEKGGLCRDMGVVSSKAR